MPIGDLLEKLARGEKLSQDDIGDLRLFGNQAQNTNAFVAGMQNGTVDINVNKIKATTGDYQISPLNMSWFGWPRLAGVSTYPQTLGGSGVLTTITSWPNSIYYPNSVVKWYDQTNGYFTFSDDFAVNTGRIVNLEGSGVFASPCTNAQLKVSFYKKSDNSLVDTSVLIEDFASADPGAIDFSFSVRVNFDYFNIFVSDVYFKFIAKSTYVTGSF